MIVKDYDFNEYYNELTNIYECEYFQVDLGYLEQSYYINDSIYLGYKNIFKDISNFYNNDKKTIVNSEAYQDYLNMLPIDMIFILLEHSKCFTKYKNFDLENDICLLHYVGVVDFLNNKNSMLY